MCWLENSRHIFKKSNENQNHPDFNRAPCHPACQRLRHRHLTHPSLHGLPGCPTGSSSSSSAHAAGSSDCRAPNARSAGACTRSRRAPASPSGEARRAKISADVAARRGHDHPLLMRPGLPRALRQRTSRARAHRCLPSRQRRVSFGLLQGGVDGRSKPTESIARQAKDASHG